jgi:hypothetical protein
MARKIDLDEGRMPRGRRRHNRNRELPLWHWVSVTLDPDVFKYTKYKGFNADMLRRFGLGGYALKGV